ncbi:hypothetical protein, partial [Nodularia spumigena]|uniref:hypothetical protein n=1 Tax=Nodularia spumigena TaxID=70799 RepID=UPI002B1F1524
ADELVRIPTLDGSRASVAFVGFGAELSATTARQAAGSAVRQLTGAASVDHPISALRRNVADFLLKPFSRNSLLEAWESVDTRRRENVTRSRRPSPRPKAVRRAIEQWRATHAPEIVGEHSSLDE